MAGADVTSQRADFQSRDRCLFHFPVRRHCKFAVLTPRSTAASQEAQWSRVCVCVRGVAEREREGQRKVKGRTGRTGSDQERQKLGGREEEWGRRG